MPCNYPVHTSEVECLAGNKQSSPPELGLVVEKAANEGQHRKLSTVPLLTQDPTTVEDERMCTVLAFIYIYHERLNVKVMCGQEPNNLYKCFVISTFFVSNIASVNSQ